MSIPPTPSVTFSYEIRRTFDVNGKELVDNRLFLFYFKGKKATIRLDYDDDIPLLQWMSFIETLGGSRDAKIPFVMREWASISYCGREKGVTFTHCNDGFYSSATVHYTVVREQMRAMVQELAVL
jgi:hypothetical protein